MADADEIIIRQARADDLEAIVAVTAEVFRPFSMEAHIQKAVGNAGGQDWLQVKTAEIERDRRADPEGCFVAERGGRVVGYVTSALSPFVSRGRIADLAVAADCQGRAVGRRLIETAIARFRRLGLKQAKIETLTCNPVGQHLYPAVGFTEVVRQIHYIVPLEPEAAGDEE